MATDLTQLLVNTGPAEDSLLVQAMSSDVIAIKGYIPSNMAAELDGIATLLNRIPTNISAELDGIATLTGRVPSDLTSRLTTIESQTSGSGSGKGVKRVLIVAGTLSGTYNGSTTFNLGVTVDPTKCILHSLQSNETGGIPFPEYNGWTFSFSSTQMTLTRTVTSGSSIGCQAVIVEYD